MSLIRGKDLSSSSTHLVVARAEDVGERGGIARTLNEAPHRLPAMGVHACATGGHGHGSMQAFPLTCTGAGCIRRHCGHQKAPWSAHHLGW
jgi:hypothetical protein